MENPDDLMQFTLDELREKKNLSQENVDLLVSVAKGKKSGTINVFHGEAPLRSGVDRERILKALASFNQHKPEGAEGRASIPSKNYKIRLSSEFCLLADETFKILLAINYDQLSDLRDEIVEITFEENTENKGSTSHLTPERITDLIVANLIQRKIA